jgi:hypothetical protein
MRYAATHATDNFQRVISHSSAMYLRPRTTEEIECEVDLLNVQYTKVIINTTYSPQSPLWKKLQFFKTMYLISPHNSIQTTTQHHVGPTNLTALQTHQEKIISAQYRDNIGNIYTTMDTQATARCPACSHTGTDKRCTTHTECEGWLVPHTMLCARHTQLHHVLTTRGHHTGCSNTTTYQRRTAHVKHGTWYNIHQY